MREVVPPLPQYVFMAWCLVKYKEFTRSGTFVMSRQFFCRSVVLNEVLLSYKTGMEI
jgi:hypothetical protein